MPRRQRRPALEALLPALAGSPDELTRATAAWSAADNAGFLLGGGVGGAAITALDPGIVVAIAAALLALAGALAIRLPSVTATEPDEPEENPEGLAGAFAGLRALVHAPLLRVPFALFAGLLVLEGTTDVQVVALSIGTLKMGNGGPGALFALWGVGGLLASAVMLMLVRRRGYGLALTGGSISFAVGLALAGAEGIPMAVAGMVPAGVGFALVEAGVMGLVPAATRR